MMHNFCDALPSMPVVSLERGMDLWGDDVAFCQINLTLWFSVDSSHHNTLAHLLSFCFDQLHKECSDAVTFQYYCCFLF